MVVLGLSGAFGRVGEDFIPGLPPWFFHDAAAAVVRDGALLAAVEEERVCRVKHCNTLPAGAVRAALDAARLRPADVDAIAYFFAEDYADNELALQYAEHPDVPLRFSRELLVDRLGEVLEARPHPSSIHFVRHHDAHAEAVLAHSGFDEALVAVLDGNGERESLSLYAGRQGALERLWTEPESKSLGHFYRSAIELLGYGRFDEYKVMGLAPYGDPGAFRPVFADLLTLGPQGRYELNVAGVRSHFLRRGFRPRRRGAAFDAEHADFAAALQDGLEAIALHVLGHWRRATGLADLCLAGGVAHNCSMNGRIAREGLFERIFADPAAHDAGASVGAALAVAKRRGSPARRPAPLADVALGTAISAAEVEGLLARWGGAVEPVPTADVVETVADSLAGGAVVGWARGRMEFGPRALGRRSILADPRPSANRDRINAIVKKRESYRPFAPMVPAELIADWFEEPATRCNLEHMIFTVTVRPERRAQLQAVTHVDGTARVQSVRSDVLPDIAALLGAFGRRTGVPILLNTSFNVDAEPIVRTAGEALLCFLCTDMDLLVLGDVLLRRRPLSDDFWVGLALVPRPNVAIVDTHRLASPPGGRDGGVEVRFTQAGGRAAPVERRFVEPLLRSDGRRPFRDCLPGPPDPDRDGAAADLVRRLLGSRLFGVAGLDAPDP